MRDLAALGREFLRPTLVGDSLWDEATSPQFPGIPGILPGFGRHKDNSWGLGLEIRGTKNPHWLAASFPPRTFGHFGQSGSFLWVDRSAGLTGAFLGSEPFSAAHAREWPGLTDAMRTQAVS